MSNQKIKEAIVLLKKHEIKQIGDTELNQFCQGQNMGVRLCVKELEHLLKGGE